MVLYLLATVCLSWVGALLYLPLLRRGAPLQQKYFLYAVTAASLLFPLAMPPDTAAPKTLPFGAVMLTAPAPEAGLRQLCHCTSPDYSHRVQYRAQAWLNFLLDRSHGIALAIALVMGLVLLVGVGEMFFLRRLVRQSRSETRTLSGTSYTLLHPKKPHGAGAFWLGQPYIIWQQELDELTPEALGAVLEHELSHLAQRHTAERMALRLLQCAWIFNPVLYGLRRELHRLGECVADQRGASTLGSAQAYSRLLIAFTERQASWAVRGFKRGNLLRQRVAQLLAPTRLGRAAFLCALGSALLAQAALTPYIHHWLNEGIGRVRAYHSLYIQYPASSDLLYCPDCETVCEP